MRVVFEIFIRLKYVIVPTLVRSVYVLQITKCQVSGDRRGVWSLMGCSAGGGFSMRAFGWGSHSAQNAASQSSQGSHGHNNHGSQEARAKLERKLCLARDTPDALFDLSECFLKAVPSGVFSLCRVFRKEALNLRDNLLSTLNDGGDLSDLFLIQVSFIC